MKNVPTLKNSIHLIISVLIVIPVAIIYGFKPSLSFDIYLQTIDEHNFFKAIMGLYLGFSGLWILGILNKKHLNIATITNVIFMLSLGLGRLLSILIDGIPALGYTFGLMGELFIGGYGLRLLSQFTNKG